jgi:hypothetical protein
VRRRRQWPPQANLRRPGPAVRAREPASESEQAWVSPSRQARVQAWAPFLRVWRRDCGPRPGSLAAVAAPRREISRGVSDWERERRPRPFPAGAGRPPPPAPSADSARQGPPRSARAGSSPEPGAGPRPAGRRGRPGRGQPARSRRAARAIATAGWPAQAPTFRRPRGWRSRPPRTIPRTLEPPRRSARRARSLRAKTEGAGAGRAPSLRAKTGRAGPGRARSLRAKTGRPPRLADLDGVAAVGIAADLARSRPAKVVKA